MKKKTCAKCERNGKCDIQLVFGDDSFACMLYEEGKKHASKADQHNCGNVVLVKERKPSAVNHPQHYTSGGIECIEGIKAATGDAFNGFLAGNVIKYVWRYRHKNGAEDVEKAIWYAKRLLDELKGESNA